MVESKAVGSFEVTLTSNSAPDAPIGGMAISKTFCGDLEGTSAGQMLAFGTAVAGSAGYVAMEKVVASLAGKHGTFVLQHSGSMNKGTPSLSVSIVPDSGTDGLTGLTGSMEIKKEAGQHVYILCYSLP